MVEHTYKESKWLNVKTAPFLNGVLAFLWNRKKSAFLNYYLNKTYGAPYYKFPKKFKETSDPKLAPTIAKSNQHSA
jgi:hypothetical protein